MLVTEGALASDYIRREWRTARRFGATLVPVLGQDMPRGTLPRWLNRHEEIYRLDGPEHLAKFLGTLRAPPKRLRAVWHDGLRLDDMVPRPGLLAAAKAQLLAVDGAPVAMSSVLAGRGGFGKTTLAAYVAQDPEIRDGFIDGVFWVTVGRESPNVLPQIEEVIRAISGKRLDTADESAAAEELRRLLAHRDALLIVDGVWTEAHLRQFLKASADASLLFTTCNREIQGPETKVLDVDKLTPSEAFEVIARGLSPTTEEAAALRQFAEAFWRWAQLLAIANRSLLRRVLRGRALMEALGQLREALSQGDPGVRDDRDLTLRAALDLSFEDLGEEAQARLALLSALPEDATVPLSVLQRAWDLQAWMAEEFCLDLEAAGWLQPKVIDGEVQLHDNVIWYLRHKVPDEVQRASHARILDANEPPAGWPSLAASETYLWESLIWHQRAAGREETAIALLRDFAWIEAKHRALGPQALYRGSPSDLGGEEVSLTKRAFGISLPTLSRHPDQLAWALTATWDWREAPPPIVDAAKRSLAQVLHIQASFESVGAELLRIAGHKGPVAGVAFSTDGRRIVSGGYDDTVCLWDASSGVALITLIVNDAPAGLQFFGPALHCMMRSGHHFRIEILL